MNNATNTQSNTTATWKKVKDGYSHYWVYKSDPRFFVFGGDGDKWSVFFNGKCLGLPLEPTREYAGYAIEEFKKSIEDDA